VVLIRWLHPLHIRWSHDDVFSRNDRPPLVKEVRSPLSPRMQSLPIEKLAQAFGIDTYAGTYTLSGTVTHQIEIASIPNRVGTMVAPLPSESDTQPQT